MYTRWSKELRVGGCTFLVFGQLFQCYLDAYRLRPKKWHQNDYTQHLHTRENFKLKFIWFTAFCAPIALFLLQSNLKEPCHHVFIWREQLQAEEWFRQKRRLLELWSNKLPNEGVPDQVMHRESHCSCCWTWWKLPPRLCMMKKRTSEVEPCPLLPFYCANSSC